MEEKDKTIIEETKVADDQESSVAEGNMEESTGEESSQAQNEDIGVESSEQDQEKTGADNPELENVNDDLYKWYTLSTYSGHEKKVAEQIKQRAAATGLEDEIVEVLVPIQEKVVAKEGKKRTVEERLLPGYVLVKMIINDNTKHVVRNTEGVIGFVGPDKSPTPLNKDEVQAIKRYTEVKTPTYDTSYKTGDAVRVTDGPFKDFVGHIQEINEGKGQVSVLLSIFGRETPVQLDFLQITHL